MEKNHGKILEKKNLIKKHINKYVKKQRKNAKNKIKKKVAKLKNTFLGFKRKEA